MTDIRDPFELVDTPWGHIEAWRASTLATGTMGALHNVYDVVRADAAATAARAEEIQNRDENIKQLAQRLLEGMDTLATRVDALEAAHRLDVEQAARQARFDEEPLTLPPQVVETDVPKDDDQHTPGGELYDLPATEDPELEVEDQVEFEEPELPKPPQIEQPTSITFDEGVLIMATKQEHYQANIQWRDHYDGQFRKIGISALDPVLGQTVNDYRRETLRLIKKTILPKSHELYGVNCRGLPADALESFEPQFLEAAVTEAWNPNNVPPGQLRERVVTDPRNGHREHHFIGQDHFIRLPNFGTDTQAMGGFRPGRRVVSFRTDQGYIDASGRGLR